MYTAIPGAPFFDVGFGHHAVHPFYVRRGVHELPDLFRKGGHTGMDQVHARYQFISSGPFPETAESPVTDWLVLKAGGVEGILETEIKFTFP